MDDEPLHEMISRFNAETNSLEKVKQALQIARQYFHELHQPDEAQQYLQEAMQTTELMPIDAELSTTVFQIGELYRDMQENEKAKQTIHRAISLGKELQDDTLQFTPYLCLGHMSVDELNHSQALEYFEQALKIAEKQKDQAMIGVSLSGVGRAYLENHDYTKALQYIRQALTKTVIGSFQRIACCVNMGITYVHLGDNALAIGYFKRVIPMLEVINHKAGIAEIYCRIGEAYVTINKHDKALQFACKARDYMAENQINIPKYLSYVYLIFIRVNTAEGNIATTEQYIEQFLGLGVTEHQYLYSFYEIATDFYAKQQRYDLAFQYIQKRYEIGSIIFNEEMKRNMAVKTANFEYEREKERAELLKEKKEELEFVINNAYESIFMISGDAFTLVNDAFYAMTGLTQEKLHDRETRFLDIIVPTEREALWAKIMKNIENKLTHFELNTRVFTIDGELVDVEIHFSNISADGELKLIGIIHDIAQKKLYEEQKLHAEKINTIITFAVTTNDFINSPLMAIQGYVEKIEEDIKNSKKIQEKTFNKVYQSVHIIKEKMHELVEFANNPHMTSLPTQKYGHTEYDMLTFKMKVEE